MKIIHNLIKVQKLISNLDKWLVLGCCCLMTISLVCLYSSNHDLSLPSKQLLRFALGFFAMLVAANIKPSNWYQLAPWLYIAGIILLIIVEILGYTGKGAQRWINLGFIRFEPSEIMKLALPMMLSWWLHQKSLPPSFKTVSSCLLIVSIPVILIIKQPDLGTALLLISAATTVIFLAGLNWRYFATTFIATITAIPIIWQHLHNYQQQRVLTFLNPEHDPLGTGYHIIQSKIAIGSGGLFGKGWLHSTQAHLNFLPEHTTDFVFALFAEEFGFIGSMILIIICTLIICRMLYMSSQAQNNFKRLLSASISIMFFIACFVNIGMVSGILPVVGVPLTFISFGGSSLITMMAAFGIVMSIHAHRDLMTN